MGTARTFQTMLNEYLPNELLAEELVKRDYILNTVEKDGNWKGGKLIVPFKAAGATSVHFGGLTPAASIVQSKYVRGSIDDYKEVWGSLIFNQRDLQEHDGKIPESTFLRLLPDEIEGFMDYLKEVVSVQFGSGPHFALVTDITNAATGIAVVDRVERFQIGQLFVLDNGTTQASVYVTAIDQNTSSSTGTLTVSATYGGSAYDYSAITGTVKAFHPGVTDDTGNFETFISMRSVLLSAANGGSTTVHGQSKLSAPILQAINVDGSTITATNILDRLFDAYNEVRRKGKGMANEFLMSLKHLGSCMKQLEAQKGPYKVVVDPKESLYGWTEMAIASTTTGQVLKIVGIQEMDDDIIPIVDWRSIKFRSNGFFKKRKSPDGIEYFEVRNTTGYQYIVDVSLFGEMEYRKPGQCGIICKINYPDPI